MNLYSYELLQKETRIVLSVQLRQKLPKNTEIMRKLRVHRNTANAWLRGEYNLSIEQLEKLGIDVKNNWDSIISIHLEGGKRFFKIPKYLQVNKLSWLLGILDGDRAGKPEDEIGICNEDTNLVKTFIDICMEAFNVRREDFVIEVQWNGEHTVHKELGINKKRIRNYKESNSFDYPQNKPIVRAILRSRIIANIIKNFRKILITEMEKDNANLFAWYVRGLMDSDGGFVKNNICLQQKTLETFQITEKILNSLNIQHGGIRKPDSRNMFRLYINSDKQNLKRYYNYIGFFSKPKLEKLKNLSS